MTEMHPLLRTIAPLISDLARAMPAPERYRRLLSALREVLPCNATAILQLQDGEWLLPLAVDGLRADTLGRRFRVAEHPRFAALMKSEGAMRFPAGSDLPDPYDGLVEGVDGHLPVHDCVGCMLYVDDKPWGLLTLDDLSADRFSSLDLEVLHAFAALTAASVSVVSRIEALVSLAEHESMRAEGFRRAVPRGRTLIGRSTAMRQLLKEVALVGGSELPVLIQGETGVGKELVAEALHAASGRSERPMVSINCAALPDTLVESELFGHVKGAFTGAMAGRLGKFEIADGGTLFLDEVGELPLAIQAKLLRVLQSGQLQRVGSDGEHRVDVRLIAASNRNLAEEVRQGRFRADLYHRLSVYPLRVPPLRERGRDALLLTGAFLEENRSRLGIGAVRLDASAEAALLAHDWPGNVRELEHLLGRSVLKALSRHERRPRILTLLAEDLDLPGAAKPQASEAAEQPGEPSAALQPVTLREAIGKLEREMVERALRGADYNWSAAARSLGVDRANLVRLAGRLGIEARAGMAKA